MFEKQPQVVQRVAASSVRALAPPCSLPRRNGQMRPRSAPVRPAGGERWRSVLVSGALPLQRTDVVGSGPYRWPPGWRSASLSLADPRVTSENTGLPGPLSQGCGGDSERGQEGTGELPQEPPPPGSDAAFVVGKGKRGPVWKIPSDRTEASALAVWRPGSAGWAGLTS